MKLAEALQERADLNRKISELRGRLMNNAVVQEGEQPLEDPNVLLQELNQSIERLTYLMTRINMTNCNTIMEGRSLTDWIAEKDGLSIKILNYRMLIQEASDIARRASRTEIKLFSAVDVSALQKQADEFSKRLRLLDNQLQENNWKTELMEQ